jgi:glycosyltransferase involved in cell wall biosynthesis
MKKEKVSVIIPAFNEEERIGSVLEVVKKVKNVSEIIVVDDGSEDQTTKIAKKAGAIVLKLPFNQGKFLAVKKGILASKGSLTAVLDADLLGFKSENLSDLISGVKDKKTISIAQFIEGRLSTNHRGINKYLSGQRAAYRSFWLEFFEEVESHGLTEEKLLKRGFSLENELNGFIKRHDYKKVYVEWSGVSHVMKEEKRGAQGFAQRIKMYFEIMINIFSRIFRFFKGIHLHTSDVG